MTDPIRDALFQAKLMASDVLELYDNGKLTQNGFRVKLALLHTRMQLALDAWDEHETR